MATTKQKKLAKTIVENLSAEKPLNNKEMLVKVGYSESVATAKPAEIIESKGVQDEIKRLGFTDERLQKKHDQLLDASYLHKVDFEPFDTDETVKATIEAIPGYSLVRIVTQKNTGGTPYAKFAYVKAPEHTVQDRALDKAYKIRGDYAPDKSISVNFQADEDALKQIISTLKPKTA